MRSSVFVLLAGIAVVANAAAPTTEQEMAGVLGHDAECVAYGLPLTSNLGTAFPATDAPRTITDVRNDTEGLKKFQSIQGSIPNIPIKTPGIAYDSAKDPDCWWTTSNCVTPKLAGLKPDIYQAPEPRTLGYGFDDGPACDHNEFYNFLGSKNQKATMFYIGIYVIWFPLQAQRAAADGHEICVHTWSHGNMTQLSNESAFAELWYTIKAIKLVTGLTPTCWRPPHGDVDDRIRFIAQSLNLDTIMWRYDSFDWANGQLGQTPQTIQGNYDKLINDAKSGVLNNNGAIILTHELSNFTMQLAIDNYPKFVDAFDHIVPVGIAMNKTQPYAETTVTFPSFNDYVAQRGGKTTSTNSTGTPSGNTSNNTGNKSGGSASQSGGANPTKPSGASAGLALRPSLGLALFGAIIAGVFSC
ncbi:Carbohydrate esterase family 4 protein [Mycena indigotica]|uniref:chitin deacetylase n=1 Tax=Mycena indigotica TaxID=2126181 RepID=A0A8H6SSB3_9AGAR|nr:Carbohydrate esterase family 4 protein [Mycena indigotica]KAF7303982.1 Carbohydrate esterase family 4 protein [Mycena indigotica]